MNCPMCGNENTSVLETRRDEKMDATLRRRICKDKECRYRFKSYEGYEPADLEAQFRLEDVRKTLNKIHKWIHPLGKKNPVVRDAVRQLETAMKLLDKEE